jgi:hypothetical protein
MAGSATYQRSKKKAAKKITLALAGDCAAMVLAAFLCAGTGFASDNLATLQQRFDRETDGVKKAKLLQKLGDAEFDKEREAAKANDFTTVGLVMEKYRDNVRAAFEALKKRHPDAEKHPSGYKQLEIHVGLGIREVQDVILAMPEPYRPPMQLVEKDLRETDMELLKLLFPRRPGEQPRATEGASRTGVPETMEQRP